MNMTQNMTEAQFVQYVQNRVKGTTAISADCVTAPKMRKTGNPYMGAEKHCTMSGLIGFDYQNSVNRLADKEGAAPREAKYRAWGTLTPDRLFVEHKGNFYLQMKVQSATVPLYFDSYGVEIPHASIEPFLQKSYKSSTQEDLDGEVVVRDVKIENLKTIRMFGDVIHIVPEHEPVVAEVSVSQEHGEDVSA